MENNTNVEQNNINTPVANGEVVASNNSGQKLSTPMAIVAAGFLIMIGIFASNMPARDKVVGKFSNTSEKTEISDTTSPLAPITSSDHILGNINTAEVAIVEFSDLECPFCKTFHVAIHNAMDKYPGKIAWVYRHFPLDSIHPKARNEAKASECVAAIGGNDAFWKYIDMVFTNTPSNNGLEAGLLSVFAGKVGVDTKKFASCLASTEFDAVVEAQYEDGVNAGVQGTPHSIIMLKDGTQIPIKGADINGLNKALEAIIK
jgi:protein-disulfide isomerase